MLTLYAAGLSGLSCALRGSGEVVGPDPILSVALCTSSYLTT